VCDPLGDASSYLHAAEENGMQIRYVIDTHVHADHISCGRKLAELAGARYVLHAGAGARFQFLPVKEDDVLDLGNVHLQVLHTPGHTPEHIALLVTDRTRGPEPWFLLSGHNFNSSYTYDAASNRTGYTAPDSSTNTYSYDTLNRLSSLANSWAGSFGFSYDALSRRTQMTRPNSITTNYSYDSLSRLLSVLHQSGGSTIDGATYTVDAAGNRTSKQDWLAAVTSNYTYDAIYQLTQATQGGNTTESYSYDPVGNRTASLGVASYTTNSSNELTATSNASYTYDANGNTTSKTDSTGTTTYAWDYENRLTSVSLPGSGGTVSFKYDPFGRRIYKSSTSATSIYAYDGDNLVEEANSSGAEVASYSQGLSIDEPLAMDRSSVASFYEADGLGSVTSLSSSAGALAETYTRDSFGKQTGSTGSLTNPFQYTARESDVETGLYYYRARYYDPNAGRFTSGDPIEFYGGINFYIYVVNSPTSGFDPSGLCLVRMYYAPVKFLGMTVGYHAYLVVSNNTGGPPSPLLFRGGPGPDGNLQALGGLPYINDPQLNPDWTPDAYYQSLLDDKSDCQCVTDKLYAFNLRVNRSNIPYRKLSTNSNAYASSAAAAAGLPLPLFKPDVPGWGTPLPLKPLPGKKQ
jgi:RHS repeat-associated protein